MNYTTRFTHITHINRGDDAVERLIQNIPILLLVTICTLTSAIWGFLKILSICNITKGYENVKNYFDSWMYLRSGPQKIDEIYFKAKPQPFEIKAPDHRVFFFSSPEHVTEIDKASQDVLSLFAATKQMFQPKHTMHGYDWVDIRGQDGIGYVRALRSLLTSHLPNILPDMRSVVRQEFKKPYTGVPSRSQVKNFPGYLAIKRMVVQVNGYVFFGKDLITNDEFMETAFVNIDHVIKASEWIRVMPESLASWIGQLVSSSAKRQEQWFKSLELAVEQRMEHQTRLKDGQKESDRPMDGIQWVIDTAPKDNPWSAGRVAKELMALWFGAIHGTSMTTTWALYDLCLHPEYIEPLRKELEGPQYLKFVETTDGLPLLDSFIKESARFNPLDSMTSRRVALEPFTFKDGTKLEKGDWACVPLRSMLKDPDLFPEPQRFDGFRFTDGGRQPEGPSKLTDVSHKWGMWGNKRLACPARFHATVIVKLILSHILLNFDMELVDPAASRVASWRTYLIPRDDTVVRLTPRRAA